MKKTAALGDSIIVNNHGDNDSSDNNGKATGLTTSGGGPGPEPFFVYCFPSSFVNCSSSPGGRPGQEPDRQPAATSLSGEDSPCSTHGPCFSSYFKSSHHRDFHPKVVILDEATSTLESCEEKQVHQLILSTLANSTVITVTHRLVGRTSTRQISYHGENNHQAGWGAGIRPGACSRGRSSA